jgi:hypothetical protein
MQPEHAGSRQVAQTSTIGTVHKGKIRVNRPTRRRRKETNLDEKTARRVDVMIRVNGGVGDGNKAIKQGWGAGWEWERWLRPEPLSSGRWKMHVQGRERGRK